MEGRTPRILAVVSGKTGFRKEVFTTPWASNISSIVARSIPLVTMRSWTTGRPVTATSQQRVLARIRVALWVIQGSVAEYRDVSADNEQVLMSTVTQPSVPIALATDHCHRSDAFWLRRVHQSRSRKCGVKDFLADQCVRVDSIGVHHDVSQHIGDF